MKGKLDLKVTRVLEASDLVAGGIYALLGAFHVVQLSKNPEANEVWLRKFGPMLKIISPLVILFGFGQLFGLIK